MNTPLAFCAFSELNAEGIGPFSLPPVDTGQHFADYNENQVPVKGCQKRVQIGLRPWLRSSTIDISVITLKCWRAGVKRTETAWRNKMRGGSVPCRSY